VRRSIIGPSAKADSALEPPRSIRLQFDLRPPPPFRLRRGKPSRRSESACRNLRPVALGFAPAASAMR